MSKMKSKNQNRLTKLVLAALLCTGGLQFILPSSAGAYSDPDTTFNFHASPSAVTIDTSVADTEGVTGFISEHPVGVYGNIEVNNYRQNYGQGALVTSNYTGKILSMASHGTNGWNTVNLIQMINDENYVGSTGSVSGYTVSLLDAPSNSNIHDVVGGFSVGATASGNTANINSGNVGHAAGGWNVSADTGGASGNTLNISGGRVADAFGGFGGLGGSATGNIINITGGEVSEAIGGSGGKESSGNTVNISGGEVWMFIHGGNSGWAGGSGPADNNTVNITGGSMFTEYSTATIYGGSGGTSASGNTVTIGGTAKLSADTNIYGGVASYSEEDPPSSGSYVTKEGTAANNTVNILIPMTVAGLYGGIGDAATSTGNTLNLAAKNVNTASIGGFQNMNFYLPPDIANNDTMLTINGGSPTDVQGVTFGVAALQGVTLAEGNTVNLLTNESGLTTDATLKTADSATLGKAAFLAANNMSTNSNYELSISKSGDNTIIARVDKVTEEAADGDQMKSPVETRAGVVTMINTGSDMIAGQGMDNAAAAVAASGGQSAPFAAMGGSSLRAESGSHVDTKGFNIGLGFAKQIENKSGKLLIGPILEYGHGSYDSYQDNGITADGKSSYWGIGVIAKQTNNSGFYYEGSLRVGRTKSDYGSNNAIAGSHLSYDSKSTFWAAHLGAGKLVDIGHDNTLDYYGKYFYSHTAGDDVGIYRDGALFDSAKFDAVNSHRLRVGARVTHTLNEKNKIYGGLAYQYEFKGDARATYQSGGTAPSPSVKGGSGMLELGWQVKPGSKSPLTIDLGVTGWVGKQRGITANLQANWTF